MNKKNNKRASFSMVIIDTVYNKYFDVYPILWTLFRFWIYIFNISFNVNYDINLILWSI